MLITENSLDFVYLFSYIWKIHIVGFKFSSKYLNTGNHRYFFIGTMSMFLTCILGISSLPGVSAMLTWREFSFIQSSLGWLALLTATLHDALLGWGFQSKDYTICSLPSGAQVLFNF